MKTKDKYNVIDLFAGAGGLSSGFTQTGKFKVLAAVENNKNMQNTYKLNHKDVDMYSDILSINFDDLKKKYKDIDIVIGGPPCQGFSNANRQHNHIVNMNNQLTKRYVDAVVKLRPKAFILENVGMLSSKKHMFLCQNNDLNDIKKLGVCTHERHAKIQLPDIVLNKVYNKYKTGYDFSNLLLCDKSYTLVNILFKKRKNRLTVDNAVKDKKKSLVNALDCYLKIISDDNDKLVIKIIDITLKLRESIESEMLDISALSKFITIQRAIMKLTELRSKNIYILDSKVDAGYIVLSFLGYTVIDYIMKKLNGQYSLEYNILNAVNYGAPQYRSRFILIGCLKELSMEIKMPKPLFSDEYYNTVKMAISDLENFEPSNDVKQNRPIFPLEGNDKSLLLKYLNDTEAIYNHINTRSRSESIDKFRSLKQGQNFHDLDDGFKTEYSQPHRTQNSIYKRLDYDKPSGTVVNVRKSMWIHPVKDRAVSIREAARLQTFSDSYVFAGTKDSQYQQVGNAVPPVLARAIAESVLMLLGDEPKEYLCDVLVNRN